MTKQTLRQRVAWQTERIRELEGRLRALELRLSKHCGDNTRHSQPEIVRGPEPPEPRDERARLNELCNVMEVD